MKKCQCDILEGTLKLETGFSFVTTECDQLEEFCIAHNLSCRSAQINYAAKQLLWVFTTVRFSLFENVVDEIYFF